MLSSYELSKYYEVTKEWYNGYRIARANVYNPWDVINWCDQLLTYPDKTPKSYWANSSGNEELREFINRLGNGVTKAQLERLIAGQTVQKKIVEQLTYDSMYDTIENMWSLLFATGYLTQSGTPSDSLVRLTIPNAEIRSIFSDFILNLFEREVSKNDQHPGHRGEEGVQREFPPWSTAWNTHMQEQLVGRFKQRIGRRCVTYSGYRTASAARRFFYSKKERQNHYI